MKAVYIIAISLIFSGCEQQLPSPAKSTNSPPATSQQPTEEIRSGITIPEIKTREIKGSELTIASRNAPKGSLLIIYSPLCHICHDTMPKWIELYNQFFKPRNIPFVAISILNESLTAESVAELKIPFQVASIQNIDALIGYKIKRVPVTMILAPDGTVKQLWLGDLDKNALSTIVTSFCPDCNVEISHSR
ncbi:MAG: hypothetical protein RMM17_01560 [Acidobacteriota bacterium]|nr:hypothetical protein [Blastocatellia bacterium]MDW8411357.1 hypothetical protein [Acidobacteriota bacterium]